MHDDPLGLVLKLIMNTRYSTKKYLYDLINNDIDDIQNEFASVKDYLSRSESSKRTLYRNSMNVDLKTHDICSKKCFINETHRVAFTRFRVSIHSLKMIFVANLLIKA